MDQTPDTQASARPIAIISAGAGSGKTFTLTGKMVDLLRDGVRPGGIMATTFTQKAATELQERVRVRLLESGMTEAANALGSALIGTVHSIGARLLQRFAFEAGVSPLVEIIAENDGQRLFNESLAQVLTEHRIETLNRLADRLGLTKKTAGEPYDWRRTIRDLSLPADTVIVSIIRGGKLVIPRGDTVLEAGDEVLAVSTVEAEAALKSALVGLA